MSSNHSTRNSILAAIILAVICLASFAHAERNDHFTVEDGFTLDEGSGLLLAYGGYPRSGVAYIGSPKDWLSLGITLDVEYLPAFELGMPFKAQLAETESEHLNFALTLDTSMYFSFESNNTDVRLQFRPGFAAGWRFIPGFCWFVSGDYAVMLPVSDKAEFAHYPEIASGFEFTFNGFICLTLKGTVEFTDYEPGDFVYGGSAGLAFAL